MKYLVFIFLILCACSSNPEMDMKLKRDIMTDAHIMHADTIGTFEDMFLYAKEFLVFQDSVLVTINRKHKDGYFLELFDLNKREYISRMFKLGEGPEEMLSANVNLNGSLLEVNDFVKSQIAIVNLDSLLQNSDYKCLPIRLNAMGSPTAVAYKDSFLLENPYCFENENLGIRQDAPRFLVTDGKQIYSEDKKYKYNTRNVAVDGRIIINEKKGRIVYANMHESKIEIYNLDLELLKLISGPVNLKADFIIENSEVSFKNSIPYAYVDYCVDENYFYLLYLGDKLTMDKKMKDFSSWIFKFDWNGEFIESYYIDGFAMSLSKSNEEASFYVTVLDDEDVPTLLKLTRK